MHHADTFLLDLAVVLGVAAATAVVARLLRQPSILGYLVAGLIVGPYLPVPLFADPARTEAMAEFGVILVMFAIGLEFRIAKLLRVLPVAGLTALIQMSALIWAGFSLGQALGWTVVESLFLGSAIAISSTMVVAGVFGQYEIGRGVRDYVLGVLILQDVVAIALIAMMTAVAAGGGLAPLELAATMGQLAAVLVGILVFGMLIVPRMIRGVARLGSPEILGVFSIGLCFGLAVLADELGYSVALGAFLAGILVAESGFAHKVEGRIGPVRDMFAAIFFVSIGMTVDPLQAWASLPVAGLVFAVVVVGQLVSVTISGVLSGNGLRRSVTAGLALGQIGEFGFILAAIGVGAGAVSVSLQSILVTVAIGTAFTTSLLVGFAPRIVHAVDHALPHRVQWLLGLYDSWLESTRRTHGVVDGDRSKTARAIRAIVFDAIALNVVFGLALVFLGRAAAWLAERFDISPAAGRVALLVVTALIVSPLVVGLIRNTASLARIAGEALSAASEEPSAAGTRIAVQTLRSIVFLTVLLGVGFPTVAVLRPLTGGLYGSIGLSMLVAAIGLYLWKRAGAMEIEFRSGAEHVAGVLSSQGAREEPTTLHAPTLPPGLDAMVSLSVFNGPAVGRTLAEIDLRAKTGATVVAIRREGSPVILPTGRERLQPDDVLALSGTREAIARAQDLLRGQAPKLPTPAG